MNKFTLFLFSMPISWLTWLARTSTKNQVQSCLTDCSSYRWYQISPRNHWANKILVLSDIDLNASQILIDFVTKDCGKEDTSLVMF